MSPLPADEPERSSPPVIVAGLVWVMVDRGRETTTVDDVLSGPAIGAALGVRAAGARPELLVTIPGALPGGARRLLDALDPSGRLVGTRPSRPLRWMAEPVLADTRRWSLEGDPRRWDASCKPGELAGRTVVLANGDPDGYSRLLGHTHPSFVAIDVEGSWVASRSWAVRECLRRAHLVTITRSDHDRLPPDLLTASQVGRRPGTVLVVKAGEAGVEIFAEGQRLALPPPGVEGRVVTDVGAGDVLLGFFAARLSQRAESSVLEAAEAAYSAARPVLSTLLRSRSFLGFATDMLRSQHAD